MARLSSLLKIMLIVALVTSMLTGCGKPSENFNYPLESVTEDGNQLSRVYRAENTTVPEVATDISNQKKPKEISKTDTERMFLVYSDEIYNLQQDPQKPQDTLIEIDNLEFVRQNYNSSFLEGYILASLLDDLFDTRKPKGLYRGYSQKDTYKPTTVYRPPSEQERKTMPSPVTVKGQGSITKRSDKASPESKSSTPSTVGSNGSITKKNSTPSQTGGTTKTISSSKSSSSSPTKMNSPPKTKMKVGSSGKITRRR